MTRPNVSGTDADLRPLFGDREQLLERAKGINACYCGIDVDDRAAVDAAWESLDDFPRRSSEASALYLPVEAARARLGADTEEIAQLEHRRWNAFYEAEGFSPMDRATLEERFRTALDGKALRAKGEADETGEDSAPTAIDPDDLEACGRYARSDTPEYAPCGRRHLCLVGWDRLDEVNEWYAELDPRLRKRDFKQADRDVTRLIGLLGDSWLDETLDRGGLTVEQLAAIPPEPVMRAFVEACDKSEGTVSRNHTKRINVVGAAIVRDGKVLCARRGEGKSLAGYWEFPGGKIEPQETARQALHREIEEELLCEVEVADEVCTSEYAYDFGVVRLTTFICHLIDGTPRLTEHADIRWETPSDMPSLAWAPVDREAVGIISALRFDR